MSNLNLQLETNHNPDAKFRFRIGFETTDGFRAEFSTAHADKESLDHVCSAALHAILEIDPDAALKAGQKILAELKGEAVPA